MLLIVICLMIGGIYACSSDSAINFKAAEYDRTTGQRCVYSHSSLDSVLNTLEVIHASRLPQSYISTAQLAAHPELRYREYFVVNGDDVFKYVVGHFRIKDFMSRDTFYYMNFDSLPGGIKQYWLMDRRELHKFLDLINWMNKQGLNDSALTVKNGHRHPAYNQKVGGVSRSYHMQGLAIDIKVGDINRSGEANAEDKKILLDYMENTLIGNEGGLGLYPNSDVIHFDVRGKRARWNSH